MCRRSWCCRPVTGCSRTVVTHPDSAEGVCESATHRDREGRPLIGESTTPVLGRWLGARLSGCASREGESRGKPEQGCL